MPVTLKEIAARSGVSVMAVSAVINKTTSTRVSAKKRIIIEQVAKEMGYRRNVVAQTLRGGYSRMIGVVIDSHAPTWLHSILRHIEAEATANGYRILISEEHNSVNNVIAAYETFQQYGVDGLICLAYDYPGQKEKFQQFFTDKANVVLVGAYDQTSLPQVYIDLESVYREALQHFIHSGRKRLAAIIVDVPNSGQQIRLALYRKLCSEFGIQIRIYNPKLCDTTDEFRKETDRCIRKFIIPEQLDAVLIHSDVLGAFFISGLARHDLRVPGDVAVITDDNQTFCAALQPPMACIDHQENEIGRQAFQIMLNLLKKEPVPNNTLIPCRLILRESAGSVNFIVPQINQEKNV